MTSDYRRHPIQAIEVRAESINAQRRPRKAGEEETAPTSHTPTVKLVYFDSEERSFAIEVVASVAVPLLEDQAWNARIRLRATFISDVAITRRDARAFANASGVFLVWPYARMYLTELARAAGVTAPLLPLVTRPRGT